MTTLTLLGLIGFLGFLCQWLSAVMRLPAILFLLLSGILIGPVFSIFNPDEILGDLLFPYISLSVAVILFEGALTLNRRELKEIGGPVRRMVSVGVVVNAAVMTIATHYIIGVSWSLSALFGAIMVVTGPTVITPMLRTVRPLPKIADVLRWEGIIIDPIGALLAVMIFQWIAVQNSAAEIGDIFTVFIGTIAVGMAMGLACGYALGLLLRNHLIPERLINFASLATVCFVFSISDNLMHESGLLAVTVMGMLLANMRNVQIDSILEFKEDLTVIFVSALFVVLAARLDFEGFSALSWAAVFLIIIMQFIARPLKIALSFIGSGFTWQEKAMVSWIGPRGIVAAAISSVFALRLADLGVEGAETLIPLSFLIIIGTVVLQSLTARPVALALKVAMPATDGILIIGSNPFSVSLAGILKNLQIDTIICDSDWEQLRLARSTGLDTYYGNPSSEHAHTHLNMAPYGLMLGLSNHFEYNVTQANSFRNEFDSRSVFILAPNKKITRHDKHLVSSKKSGRILFDESISYKYLTHKLDNGWTIKSTVISEEFSYDDWSRVNPEALIIMLLKKDKSIQMNAVDESLDIQHDDTIVFFVNNEKKDDT